MNSLRPLDSSQIINQRNPLFNKPNNNINNTNQQRSLIAVVKVDVGENEKDVIRVYQGDDIIQLAQNFCKYHHLEDNCVAHMVKHITQQINIAQAKISTSKKPFEYTKDHKQSQSSQNTNEYSSIYKQHQKDKLSIQSSEREDISSLSTNSSSHKGYFMFHHQEPQICNQYLSSKGSIQFENSPERKPSFQATSSSEACCQINFEKWQLLIGEKKFQEKQNGKYHSSKSPDLSKSRADNNIINSKSSYQRSQNQTKNDKLRTEPEISILETMKREGILPKTLENSKNQKKQMIIENVYEPLARKKSTQYKGVSDRSHSPLSKSKILNNIEEVTDSSMDNTRLNASNLSNTQRSSKSSMVLSSKFDRKHSAPFFSPNIIKQKVEGLESDCSMNNKHKISFHLNSKQKQVPILNMSQIIKSQNQQCYDSKYSFTERESQYTSDNIKKQASLEPKNKQDTANKSFIQTGAIRQRQKVFGQQSDQSFHSNLQNEYKPLSYRQASSINNVNYRNNNEGNSDDTQFESEAINVDLQELIKNKENNRTIGKQSQNLQPTLKNPRNQVNNKEENEGFIKRLQSNQRLEENRDFNEFIQSKIFSKMDGNRDGLISVVDVVIESLSTDILKIVQDFLFQMADHPDRVYSFDSFLSFIEDNVQIKQQLVHYFNLQCQRQNIIKPLDKQECFSQNQQQNANTILNVSHSPPLSYPQTRRVSKIKDDLNVQLQFDQKSDSEYQNIYSLTQEYLKPQTQMNNHQNQNNDKNINKINYSDFSFSEDQHMNLTSKLAPSHSDHSYNYNLSREFTSPSNQEAIEQELLVSFSNSNFQPELQCELSFQNHDNYHHHHHNNNNININNYSKRFEDQGKSGSFQKQQVCNGIASERYKNLVKKQFNLPTYC